MSEERKARIRELNKRVKKWDSPDVSESCLIALLSEMKSLILAVEEYVNYEHSGDPWEEDSRVMGEMILDAWKDDGSLDKLKAMVEECAGT